MKIQTKDMRLRYILIPCLCAVLGCAETPDTVAELRASIPEWMDRAGVPGLSIAVVRSGELVWTAAFGITDIQTKSPVTQDTVFQAASLSKPVFALAYLKMLEEEGLDLDRPLAEDYEYNRFEEAQHHATLTPRHVLSHRTGLPNWDREGTLDFDRAPGARYGYSGEGFVYLQRFVESVTGETLEVTARKRVLDPLGMERSDFVYRDAFEASYASGHDAEGAAKPGNRYEEANAAYSLLTTAPDYAKFLISVMNGGGLTPSTLDEVFSVQTTLMGDETRTKHPKEVWERISWGLSWGIQDADEDPGRIYWHWGDNGTYRSLVAFEPTGRNGFVYFTNSENGLALGNEIAKRVVGDMAATLKWLGYETLP